MKPITEQHLRCVVDCFSVEGEFAGALPYGSGHINDTFAAYYQLADGTSKRYILQRINTHVFKDPKAVMENVIGVTHYLGKEIVKAGGDPIRETLNLIATKNGEYYHVDEDGGFWRMYIFIEDTTTYQMVKNAADFYNSARAFGKFQLLLADYPAATLHETIPLFHNTVDRVRQFKEALAANATGRANDVCDEIEFVLAREADTHVLVDQLADGKLPLRVTHNDTKLNNVLIDNATGEGICIIDLDTVMPGLSLYDFGDSIRFGATTAAEDEPDLSKVNFDISLFEAYTKGYLEVAGKVLTANEIQNLPMGAKLMTLECGMRFLADHIAGDTYFKIHREGHNLDRARTQFKLVADMEQQWDEMHKVVKKYI
ncbi:phosphotransferase family enzyme [Hydrogenoanaerobacterium saccharovorans]|uniref:Phosphotransferase enzyme family protein n=1 Tax=Hydrogenoanaerobacterium saccharovorans TaxID=474960 RepID=A0A1H7ZHL6_9FIRM|nr:phosphotransferase family enzyme [Hydrogenoanaerobacterium saccharovorans]SEM57038.1 Phosphotransferase enzyme family protein [Hydrogenoanaerobacterium saccharovorans]